jgi:hypothetical protein
LRALKSLNISFDSKYFSYDRIKRTLKGLSYLTQLKQLRTLDISGREFEQLIALLQNLCLSCTLLESLYMNNCSSQFSDILPILFQKILKSQFFHLRHVFAFQSSPRKVRTNEIGSVVNTCSHCYSMQQRTFHYYIKEKNGQICGKTNQCIIHTNYKMYENKQMDRNKQFISNLVV